MHLIGTAPGVRLLVLRAGAAGGRSRRHREAQRHLRRWIAPLLRHRNGSRLDLLKDHLPYYMILYYTVLCYVMLYCILLCYVMFFIYHVIIIMYYNYVSVYSINMYV